MCRHCNDLVIRYHRNKYDDVAKVYLSYCKKRKRKASRTRMLYRRMIRFFEKLIIQRDKIHKKYGKFSDIHLIIRSIFPVLVRGKEMFEGSFKAFYEGIRLKNCIHMHQKLMNIKLRCVASDTIYANNTNRKYCKNMIYPLLSYARERR